MSDFSHMFFTVKEFDGCEGLEIQGLLNPPEKYSCKF